MRELVAPVITSPATVSVAENETTVIDIVGTDNLDSEGDNLVYAITAGADQALFAIDASTGVLSFITAPNFEAPADAGADNVYEVQVTLSDLGGLTAVQVITITVTGEDDTPIRYLPLRLPSQYLRTALPVSTLTATDTDIPAQALTFTIIGATQGSNILLLAQY